MPLLVDGMNVIGSVPNGWWRDRDRAVRNLVDALVVLEEPLTVVFDGAPVPGLVEGTVGHVTVLYAKRGGADAADDRIIELLDEAPAPGSWTLVTSDRKLRDRARARGATVEGVSLLLERLR